MITVGDLKNRLLAIPDDYEIWMEYPERYGFHTPTRKDFGIFDDQDFIEPIGIGSNSNKKRIYLMHHL